MATRSRTFNAISVRTRLAVKTLFGALFLVCPSVASAQITLEGSEYKDVSTVLRDVGAASLVYRPAGSEGKQLYFVPFFVFKADEDGRLDVAVLNGTAPNTKQVAIWLLLSPQNKVDGIASFIRNEEAKAPVDPRYANVQPGQLIGLLLSNLEVTEEESGVGFRAVRQTNFSAQGEIQLVAEVKAEEAEQIAADLRAGKKGRLSVFNIRYDLFARKKLSQSDIQADLCFLSETKAMKDLRGASTPSEKYDWKVGADGVGASRTFLTRDQKDTFEGKLRAEVKVTLRLEDDRDAAFLQIMTGYSEKLFQRLVIDTDKTPLGQQLARISLYDFDIKDISPDKIDKLVSDCKNFFNSEDMTFSNTEVGASASFMGFGGSASAKFTRQELRARMEDKGWKFEQVGTRYLPKGFEVHVTSATALKAEGAVSGTVLREQRQFARFNHRVSTSNLYFPKCTADALVAFEELRGRVKRQEDTVASLATGLAATKQGLDATNQNVKGLDARLKPLETKVTKITDGWFLIQSELKGNVNSYILDVNGGKADGHPGLILVGSDQPATNRRWRLILQDK